LGNQYTNASFRARYAAEVQAETQSSREELESNELPTKLAEDKAVRTISKEVV
jgi:hypothetical protein